MVMNISVSPPLLRKYREGKPLHCNINQEQRSWQCGINIIGMFKCLDLS